MTVFTKIGDKTIETKTIEAMHYQLKQLFYGDASKIWITSGVGKFNKKEYEFQKFPSLMEFSGRLLGFGLTTIKSSDKKAIIEYSSAAKRKKRLQSLF